MEKELYQAVAYIALRQKDGSPMISVPLYVKVTELNKNGMTESQESVMHRIYFANAKKSATCAGGLPPARGV